MTWPQYRRREFTFAGEVHRLEPQPHEILTLLLLNRGRWVDRETIFEALWPHPDWSPIDPSASILVAISKVRHIVGRAAVVVWSPRAGGSRYRPLDVAYMLKERW